jgi:transposase
MQEKRRKYSPEFKVEAARLVVESSRPIVEVAREIGVHEGTLGSWVSKYRTEHAGDEPPLTLSERARLRELEREVRELRMKTEFLGKAAAFFASIGEREVRVHRCGEGSVSHRKNVCLAGGVHLGLLRVAQPAAVGRR